MARKSNNTALNLISDNSGNFGGKVQKSITYVAATTGATGSTTLATVTGVVAVQVFAIVDTTLTITPTSTIEVGTATSTAGLLPQVASDALDVSEIWHDATPDATIELTSVLTKKIISENIVQKITTETITGGAMTYYILWAPISRDGNVVVA